MDDRRPDTPDDDAFVRDLLAEVGGEPAPLPDDVRARLDRTLADLVGERDQGAGPAEALPAPLELDRARRRRRRFTQGLVAAAAVTIGGYSLVATGVLGGALGGADSGDAATAGSAAEGSGDPGDSGGSAESPTAVAGAGAAFPLSSGSLRADARALTDADPGAYLAPAPAPQLAEDRTGAELDAGGSPSSDGPLAEDGARTSRRDVPCVDPPAPARLPRYAVTFDGVPATAVLSPVPADATGTSRVRVEVWDCGLPTRLASVVVRR